MVKYPSSKHVTSWDGNCICYDQLGFTEVIGLSITVPSGHHYP